MLTDREKEILDCIVDNWDEAGASMIGDVSYQEVFELLDRLGLKRPERISAFLHAVDVDKIRDPADLMKLWRPPCEEKSMAKNKSDLEIWSDALKKLGWSEDPRHKYSYKHSSRPGEHVTVYPTANSASWFPSQRQYDSGVRNYTTRGGVAKLVEFLNNLDDERISHAHP